MLAALPLVALTLQGRIGLAFVRVEPVRFDLWSTRFGRFRFGGRFGIRRFGSVRFFRVCVSVCVCTPWSHRDPFGLEISLRFYCFTRGPPRPLCESGSGKSFA